MKPNEAAEKQEIMYRLKNAGELYVLLSMCTGEPYVVCDQETYDDEIIVFFDSQAAVEEAKEQTEAGTPVRPMKLENKQFLIFYTSLYTLGVNALLVKDGGRNSLIQLQDFVKRNKQQGQETGEKVWVENPSLHLTMLYYMQELRKKPGQENLPEIKEWQDEISNGFSKFLWRRRERGWLLSKSTNSYSRLSLQIYWNFRNLTGRENCVPLW